MPAMASPPGAGDDMTGDELPKVRGAAGDTAAGNPVAEPRPAAGKYKGELSRSLSIGENVLLVQRLPDHRRRVHIRRAHPRLARRVRTVRPDTHQRGAHRRRPRRRSGHLPVGSLARHRRQSGGRRRHPAHRDPRLLSHPHQRLGHRHLSPARTRRAGGAGRLGLPQCQPTGIHVVDRVDRRGRRRARGGKRGPGDLLHRNGVVLLQRLRDRRLLFRGNPAGLQARSVAPSCCRC